MELLIKSLIISLFCVGLRITSSKGYLLYFLRMPYERLEDLKKLKNKLIESSNKIIKETYIVIESKKGWHDTDENAKKLGKMLDLIRENEKTIKSTNPNKNNWLILPLKVFIGCIVCMASYTWLIDYLYYTVDKWTILTVFIVACLNPIIYTLYLIIEAYYKKLTK